MKPIRFIPCELSIFFKGRGIWQKIHSAELYKYPVKSECISMLLDEHHMDALTYADRGLNGTFVSDHNSQWSSICFIIIKLLQSGKQL